MGSPKARCPCDYVKLVEFETKGEMRWMAVGGEVEMSLLSLVAAGSCAGTVGWESSEAGSCGELGRAEIKTAGCPAVR